MAVIVDAGVASASASAYSTIVDGEALLVQTAESTAEAYDAIVEFTPAGGGTGTFPVSVEVSAQEPATIHISGRGGVSVTSHTVPTYSDPVGTVDNIEDLATAYPSPTNGMVIAVLGTDDNREPLLAIYFSSISSWVYQPIRVGTDTAVRKYVAPMVGTTVTMPNFVSFLGLPVIPKYWSVSTFTGTISYSLPAVDPVDTGVIGGSPTIWRWKVEDLPDPGSGSYNLTSWKETSGSGPTWVSNYSPKVKARTTFNISKNKSKVQRSILFEHTKVHHLTLAADVPTPFTVIIVGIIQSYPTAKYGHYLLDSGKATAVRSLAGGKDYYFSEGTNPRQTLLFMKHSARMGVNNQPAKDMKKFPNIRIKHSEKARPRMFYGVFDGASSRMGAIDTKYRFAGSGTLTDLGTHHYFSIGRRVNRVSDNRATHLTLWDVAIIHGALSQDEINKYYENIASEYHFKEYS